MLVGSGFCFFAKIENNIHILCYIRFSDAWIGDTVGLHHRIKSAFGTMANENHGRNQVVVCVFSFLDGLHYL